MATEFRMKCFTTITNGNHFAWNMSSAFTLLTVTKLKRNNKAFYFCQMMKNGCKFLETLFQCQCPKLH